MEFVVGTEEYMFIAVTETTGELTNTLELLGAAASYSIYEDDRPLTTPNSVVDGMVVQGIEGDTFKCKVAPLSSWTKGRYALYLKITNIPGFAEKPRFGPFIFNVIQ